MAALLGYALTIFQVPTALAKLVGVLAPEKILFLLFVQICFFIIGMFMDTVPAILILVPILTPLAVARGVEPIHFGILITVNMEVGMCHPPVGLNLYVASGIAKMGITELTIAVWPCCCLVVLPLRSVFSMT